MTEFQVKDSATKHCAECYDLADVMRRELAEGLVITSAIDQMMKTDQAKWLTHIMDCASGSNLVLGIDACELILADISADFQKHYLRSKDTKLTSKHFNSYHNKRTLRGISLFVAEYVISSKQANPLEITNAPEVRAYLVDGDGNLSSNGLLMMQEKADDISALANLSAAKAREVPELIRHLSKIFLDKTKTLFANGPDLKRRAKAPRDVQEVIDALKSGREVYFPESDNGRSGFRSEPFLSKAIAGVTAIKVLCDDVMSTPLKIALIQSKLMGLSVKEAIANFGILAGKEERSVRSKRDQLVRQLAPLQRELVRTNPDECPTCLLSAALLYSA